MADKLEQIKVKSKLPDNRVALSEAHPEHPGGSVYVAGQTKNKLGKDGKLVIGADGVAQTEENIVTVAKTSLVLSRLSDGFLEEITAKK